MKIGIISSKRTLFSTQRLAEAARKRRHDARIIDPARCICVVEGSRLVIEADGRRLDDFDCIIPRIGASLTAAGVAVVSQFELMGTPSLNTARAIAISRDKLQSLQHLAAAGVPVPRSISVRDPETVDSAFGYLGGPPVILKMLWGTQGIGVIKAESVDNARSTLEALWALGEQVLVQEYVATSLGRDTRVIVADGHVVAAMERIAAPGDFRSNLHRGGSSRPLELDESTARIALHAVEALGLSVAGVDMLQGPQGPLVIEVNSSPGLEGIETTTGRDVAGAILRAAERLVESRSPQVPCAADGALEPGPQDS